VCGAGKLKDTLFDVVAEDEAEGVLHLRRLLRPLLQQLPQVLHNEAVPTADHRPHQQVRGLAALLVGYFCIILVAKADGFSCFVTVGLKKWLKAALPALENHLKFI
jgi:hypothetical protein